MNVKRLERLATFLEKEVDRKKFHLGAWMKDSLFFTKKLHKTRDPSIHAFTKKRRIAVEPGYTKCVLEPNFCQTIGCAMGWATTIPEFKRAGLKLVSFWYSDDGDDPTVAEVFYHGKLGFDAAADFFDISVDVAGNLFCPIEYDKKDWSNPKAVAKRIRVFIK